MIKVAIAVNWLMIALLVLSAIYIYTVTRQLQVWSMAFAFVPYVLGLSGLYSKAGKFWKWSALVLVILFCLVVLQTFVITGTSKLPVFQLIWSVVLVVPMFLTMGALLAQIFSKKPGQQLPAAPASESKAD